MLQYYDSFGTYDFSWFAYHIMNPVPDKMKNFIITVHYKHKEEIIMRLIREERRNT